MTFFLVEVMPVCLHCHPERTLHALLGLNVVRATFVGFLSYFSFRGREPTAIARVIVLNYWQTLYKASCD